MEQALRRSWKVTVSRIPQRDPVAYSVRIEDGGSDPELRERTVGSEPLASLRGMLDCLYQHRPIILVDQRVESGPSSVMVSASLTDASDAMRRLLEGEDVEIRPDATREELIACLDILGAG